MNKKEFYVIGFALAALIPLVLFIVFWWSIAGLKIYKILIVPESLIAIFAVMGLLIGIIIDVLFLKRLIPQFYQVKISLMIIVYLICSVIAVAFFMGIPIGNLFLGTIAGLYIGRKYHYIDQNNRKFSLAAKTTCMFTALVTAFEALLIGLLILQDGYFLRTINKFLDLQIFSLNKFIDILIIVLLCFVLFIVQFLLTKAAANFAFKY